MFYLHDRKTGLIFPFPFFSLVWRYKKQLFVFGIAAQLLAPMAWSVFPKPEYIVEAEKKESLRLDACEKSKDVEFCKISGGFR